MSQDSRDIDERVTEILNAADSSSGSLLGDEEGDGADLLETAEAASDLLESAEPDELLAAVGLDTLPDGSEPDSIPEAIARGDPEQVAELQRLLHLSNLADGDDEGALEGAVDELRESIGDEAETADEGETEDGEAAAGDETEDETPTEDDSEAGDETEGDDGLLDIALGSSDGESEAAAQAEADDGESEAEGGAREAVASAAETVSEASGLDGVLEDDEAEAEEAETEGDEGTDDEGDESESSDIGDRLRSAVESSLTDVGDDLEGLHDRLQERSASSVGGERDDEDDTAAGDEEEDDGLVGSGLGSSDDGGGDGTRHSTMAPPPSERADMKTTRHSTMPKRH